MREKSLGRLQAEAPSCDVFLLAASSVSGRRGTGMSWFGHLA